MMACRSYIEPVRRALRLMTRLRGALSVFLIGLMVSGCVSYTDLSDLTPEERRKRLAAVRPNWVDHFENIEKGAILISIEGRWLVYWEPGGAKSHAFPIAVPLNDDLTKTGATTVVRRKELPSWTATPDMIARNPEVPRFIGPGPHNPLGVRALYLGWRFYAIHGTNTPGAIGDRATSGCFRLFNEDIEWLYDNVGLGTPVKVIYSVDVEEVPPENLGVSGVPSGQLPASALAPVQGPNSGGDPNALVVSTPILDSPGATPPPSAAPQSTAPQSSAPVYRAPDAPDPRIPDDGRVFSTPILDNPPADNGAPPVSDGQSSPSPLGFNRG